jgi:hypothetical protein
MNTTFKTLISVIILTFTLTACNKTPDFDTPDRTPKTEQTINQSFGMTISSKTTPMTKGWDKTTWIYNYSPTPATLTLTGTGESAGRTYTKSCTVDQLKSGSVSVTMLPGVYTATFSTPHTQSLDVWSLFNNPVETINATTNRVGEFLDIAINNTDLNITGSPLSLTATLEDALVIIDVPNITSATSYLNASLTTPTTPRLINSIPTLHFGYIDNARYIQLMPGGQVVDGSTFLKGNVYQIITNFGATVELNIPNMLINQVVI